MGYQTSRLSSHRKGQPASSYTLDPRISPCPSIGLGADGTDADKVSSVLSKVTAESLLLKKQPHRRGNSAVHAVTQHDTLKSSSHSF